MQTTAGLIVCVIVPIVLLVGYDLIRRRLYEKKKGNDMETLLAELAALRQMQNAEGRMQNAESEATPQTEVPPETEAPTDTTDTTEDEKQSN